MTRTVLVWSLAIGSAASMVAVSAQVQSLPVTFESVPQVRDPSQPQVRRIPFGTGSITGVVLAADTGRPVRGARVMINGTTGAPASRVGGTPGMGTVPGQNAGMVGSVMGSLTSVQPGVPQTGSGLMTSLTRTVVTGDQGEFAVTRLPAGTFSLNVSHNQFMPTAYGQRRQGSPGITIQLADGQKMAVKLPMTRGGVITGTVFDERGEPQRNAQVRAWRYAYANGVRRPQSTNGASTDDRGVYRMFNLQPGDYVVSATPNVGDAGLERLLEESEQLERAIAAGSIQPPATPGAPSVALVSIPAPAAGGTQLPPPASLPTYAPSSPSPIGAAVLQIVGGEERGGVDIHVRPMQAGTVQGQVATPIPSGTAVQVWLTNDDAGLDGFTNTGSTRLAQNANKFMMRGLAPGQYTVRALTVPTTNPVVVGGVVTAPGPPPKVNDAERLWGAATVSVAEGTTSDVTLVLQGGRTISGSLQFDMTRSPDLARMKPTVNLVSMPLTSGFSTPQPQAAEVAADGSFRIEGVPPGRYTWRTNVGPVRSAIAGGVDTLDFPIEFTGERDLGGVVLTVSDRTTALTGVVTDATGQPLVDITLIILPAESRYWTPGSRRVVTSRANTAGAYSVRGLPPGDYVLAAVTDLEQGQQYDPEFLRALAAGGVRVQLTEGGVATQNIGERPRR